MLLIQNEENENWNNNGDMKKIIHAKIRSFLFDGKIITYKIYSHYLIKQNIFYRLLTD
jgi:hypothetical protein